MSDPAEPQYSPRAGSGQDLSRRMDRLEANHEQLAKDVSTLAATVMRVETNQTHASELNKLRFDALDTGIANVRTDLSTFMTRINGIIAGEVRTPQMEQGEAIITDYRTWRRDTDSRLELIERARLADVAGRRSVVETIGVGKAVVIFGLSLMGGLVAVVDIVAKLAHQT